MSLKMMRGMGQVQQAGLQKYSIPGFSPSGLQQQQAAVQQQSASSPGSPMLSHALASAHLAPRVPLPVFSLSGGNDDCWTLYAVSQGKATPAQSADLMVRIQRGLNYVASKMGTWAAVPLTGTWDYATGFSWMSLVLFFSERRDVAQYTSPITPPNVLTVYKHDPTTMIDCDGLKFLAKIVWTIAMETGDSALNAGNLLPLTAGVASSTPPVTTPTPDGKGKLSVKEVDGLWMLDAASGPQLHRVLMAMSYTEDPGSAGGIITAKGTIGSSPPAAGADAFTQMKAKIAAGYAAVWKIQAHPSPQWELAFTQDPAVLVSLVSTTAAAQQAAMQGLGQMIPPGQSFFTGGSSSGSSTTLPIAPSTGGRAPYALMSIHPEAVVNQARLMAGAVPQPPIGTPNTVGPGQSYCGPDSVLDPSTGLCVSAGGPAGCPPGTVLQADGMTCGAPTAQAAATSTMPSWALPVGVLAAVGIGAYLLLA